MKNILIFFLKNLFLERGGGREKERERNINVWLPLRHPLLGTGPSTQAWALIWEWNEQPFGSQAGTQSAEPHQPGPYLRCWKRISESLHKNVSLFIFVLYQEF